MTDPGKRYVLLMKERITGNVRAAWGPLPEHLAYEKFRQYRNEEEMQRPMLVYYNLLELTDLPD